MAVAAAQVAVSTAATVIVAAQNANFLAEREGASGVNRRRVLVTNLSAGAIFLGGSGVTIATGYSVAQNASVTIDLYPDEALYGIVAAGSSTASYLAAGA